MKVISNQNSNHFYHIKSLALGANQLIIVSPFLMDNFDIIFNEIKETRIKQITLITTLKDNNVDLFKKANSLHSFSVNCLTNLIDFQIHIDNKLHGKIYIALNDDAPLRAIITSANFTEAGLGYNNEWGVQIEDIPQINEMLDELYKVSSEALKRDDIGKIIRTIDSYSNCVGEPKLPKIDLKVNGFINYKEAIKSKEANKSDIRYFIKPVGWAEKPFSVNRILSSDIETLHFSKRKPAAIRIGDILICYAVGTTKLLGYFEVLEEPEKLADTDDRWPWAVKAKNLCPDYSNRWNFFNNTIASIQESYEPTLPKTFVGGKTLGALQFGADRIRLNEIFAEHVISTIDNNSKY